MRLEWLEDILAVLETGSLIRAAEQRFVTQSAFSRRIKTIEEYIDVELFDRSSKPVRLKKSVYEQKEKIQYVVSSLRELKNELKEHNQHHQHHQNSIILVSQHTITSSVTANLISNNNNNNDIRVRLRSDSLEECYELLLTRQANLAVIYQSMTTQSTTDDTFLEFKTLGIERLIPVFATTKMDKLNKEYSQGELSVINYPHDVFLGQVISQEIFPYLSSEISIKKVVDTALTIDSLQFAINGLGVAWVPQLLALDAIESKTLTDLSDLLPSTELSTIAIRTKGKKSPTEELFWEKMGNIKEFSVKKRESFSSNTSNKLSSEKKLSFNYLNTSL